MSDLLEAALAVRRELASIHRVEVPSASGEPFVIESVSGQRVVVFKRGGLLGLFYAPHCPDVLHEAAGFEEGEADLLGEAVRRVERQRTELCAAFEEAVARLRESGDAREEVRGFLHEIDAERKAIAAERYAAAKRWMARRQRRRPLTLMQGLSLSAGLGFGVIVVAEVLERCR
jgi:hypothetical protein